MTPSNEPSWFHCPLCVLEATVIAEDERPGYDSRPDPFEPIAVDCKRCGSYSCAEFRGKDGPWGITASERPYLSCATRQAWARGNRLGLTEDRIAHIASSHKSVPVVRMMEAVLSYLAKNGRPGAHVHIKSAFDYPLFDTISTQEAEFILEQLRSRGLLEFYGDGRYMLTSVGWNLVEPMGPAGAPGRCFVAMSFHDSMTGAFELGFLPAIETDSGLRCVRIDREHFTGKISDRMLSDIRQAQLVVADFSLHRPNVYFEAGFALALGRPVIWTCQRDGATQVGLEFDTQQYQHMFWSSAEDLRTKLANKIHALGLNVPHRG